jgi:hypothetical protein
MRQPKGKRMRPLRVEMNDVVLLLTENPSKPKSRYQIEIVAHDESASFYVEFLTLREKLALGMGQERVSMSLFREIG